MQNTPMDGSTRRQDHRRRRLLGPYTPTMPTVAVALVLTLTLAVALAVSGPASAQPASTSEPPVSSPATPSTGAVVVAAAARTAILRSAFTMTFRHTTPPVPPRRRAGPTEPSTSTPRRERSPWSCPVAPPPGSRWSSCPERCSSSRRHRALRCSPDGRGSSPTSPTSPSTASGSLPTSCRPNRESRPGPGRAGLGNHHGRAVPSGHLRGGTDPPLPSHGEPEPGPGPRLRTGGRRVRPGHHRRDHGLRRQHLHLTGLDTHGHLGRRHRARSSASG